MNMHNTYHQLSNIPKGIYEGYLWSSDAKEPIVISGKYPDFSKWPTDNPFIIEGLLYDTENKTSVLIRHTGAYHITVYDLEKIPKGAELYPVEFLPHRKIVVKKVCFQQLWIPEKSASCADMEVLEMKALLFTGFKN